MAKARRVGDANERCSKDGLNPERRPLWDHVGIDNLYWEECCMTDYLIATRAATILWTSLAVMPAEIFFHAIEAELRRRGVEP